jgi:GNAT superfamily N-acetyltransferase
VPTDRRLADLDQSYVRTVLDASGLEPPHAFIRGIRKSYDLKVHLDALLRPISEPDDFRIATGDGEDERWVFLERLAWDSEFFGHGVARLHASVGRNGPPGLRTSAVADVAAIGRAIRLAQANGVDYVYSIAQAADLPFIRALSEAGFSLIETRCFYHRPLDGPPSERYSTRVATEADIPSLARAARIMVNPFDRFHADPAIAPVDADRMMERWIEASIGAGFADVTIVPDEAEPEAFCTARYHRDHWEGWGMNLSQPVFSAVAPKHRGWYVKLISELGEHLRSAGATHSYLCTQVTNNAVIRTWEKLGYQYGKAEHVFRILL